MNFAQRRALIWLVILAFFGQVAMPQMRHSSSGMVRGLLSLEMCSTQGKQSVSIKPGKTLPSGMDCEHCPACLSPVHAAPPIAVAGLALSPLTHAAPVATLHSATPTQQWIVGNPRAPPRFLV